jgi:hypothetical protein
MGDAVTLRNFSLSRVPLGLLGNGNWTVGTLRIDPPLPVFLDCGVHRVGREIQLARPNDGPHLDPNLREQPTVPQSCEHPCL